MTRDPSFFLIGTKYGRTQDVLPGMLSEGVVSTGFVDTLDLSPTIGYDYQSAQGWVERQIPNESSVAKNTLARFATIRPGDLVALKSHSAPSGNQARLVIARYAIVAGRDNAIYTRLDALGHSLKVDFLDEQQPIELPLGYGQTLHLIDDPSRINSIFGQYAQAARDRISEVSENGDKATHRSEVDARGRYLITRTHNKLQNQLRKVLEKTYGPGLVKQEESYVDLMVALETQILLFEVKSSPSPVTCIREALGQLLQYSWNLEIGDNRVRYVVVGPSNVTADDESFLQHVINETRLPLSYCTPGTYDALQT